MLTFVLTTKQDFIVLSQVNEISLTVLKFHQPLIILLTVNIFVNGKQLLSIWKTLLMVNGSIKDK